jgi:diaminopimelate epimerase
LPDAVAVNVGNPHAIFFVADVENIDVNKYGMMYENHKIFPQRANISFAQIISKNNINLRVWERGVGITLACGTAACATVVAAGRLNFIDNDVTVNLPGGKLNIILEKDNVIMTGPASISFKGVLQ